MFFKLQRSFGFFCSINHLSRPLRKHMFTCDWCVSINLVCFCVSRFADCDRSVSHCFRQWLTSSLCSFLWSFLFLSLARKQCLPPALNKNSTHHRDFLRFSWVVKGHSQFCFCGPSWVSCVALWCALTPPPLKWLTEQKNPFEICKHAARYNKFGHKWCSRRKHMSCCEE